MMLTISFTSREDEMQGGEWCAQAELPEVPAPVFPLDVSEGFS